VKLKRLRELKRLVVKYHDKQTVLGIRPDPSGTSAKGRGAQAGFLWAASLLENHRGRDRILSSRGLLGHEARWRAELEGVLSA
jgi:hypothetical protein